jgi:hypothetical protein
MLLFVFWGNVLSAQAQTAMQVIQNAAAAMGGRDRIQSVKTLLMEGHGTDLDQGFTIRPADDVQAFYYVLDFKRQLDVTNERMLVDQLRASAWPFAAERTVNNQTFGIDGDIAYNLNANGTATRGPAAQARDRRIQMLHHPLMILRAALNSDAQFTNLRKEGKLQLVDIFRHRDHGKAILPASSLAAAITCFTYPMFRDLARQRERAENGRRRGGVQERHEHVRVSGRGLATSCLFR